MSTFQDIEGQLIKIDPALIKIAIALAKNCIPSVEEAITAYTQDAITGLYHQSQAEYAARGQDLSPQAQAHDTWGKIRHTLRINAGFGGSVAVVGIFNNEQFQAYIRPIIATVTGYTLQDSDLDWEQG